MKDYRAATWAIVATTLMVLAAASVIPATAAILGLAAGCSGVCFLHAAMSPRTETVEIQVGAVNIAPVDTTAAPSNLMEMMATLAREYGGDFASRSPGDAGGWCPVHGVSCPNSD